MTPQHIAEIGSEPTATPCDVVGNTLLIAKMDASANLPTACCLSLLTRSSNLNLLGAEWSDISEDKDGVADGIFQVKWDKFSSKQLHVICTRLSIEGLRNARKQDMVDRIIRSHKDKTAYGEMMAHAESKMLPNQQDKVPRKKFNVLFG